MAVLARWSPLCPAGSQREAAGGGYEATPATIVATSSMQLATPAGVWSGGRPSSNEAVRRAGNPWINSATLIISRLELNSLNEK